MTRYAGGEEGTRRYYQDAAVRAVLEKLARGEKRALLSLATGAGKTRIAVNLLRRIADAGLELSGARVDPTHVFALSQVYEGLLLKMGRRAMTAASSSRRARSSGPWCG